jgi:hypothetical protein
MHSAAVAAAAALIEAAAVTVVGIGAAADHLTGSKTVVGNGRKEGRNEGRKEVTMEGCEGRKDMKEGWMAWSETNAKREPSHSAQKGTKEEFEGGRKEGCE